MYVFELEETTHSMTAFELFFVASLHVFACAVDVAMMHKHQNNDSIQNESNDCDVVHRVKKPSEMSECQ